LDKKTACFGGCGHRQVLSFDSLKIILYNSRGGVFDEEISTSKPLLEHSTSILGVWVNHVIIHKYITLYYQNKKKVKVPSSSSNTPPRELYGIILSESNDKT